MEILLQVFIWIPLIGFLLSLFIPRKKEGIISGLAIAISSLHLIATLLFFIYWLTNSHPLLDIKHLVLYESQHIEIFIDFYFDKITATFLVVGSLLIFLVMIFSRYYMHRDPGFKRYFILILLFFLGYNLIIFAGNFETLFIGWEILGICSFLLIGFFRDRYLPIKNSLKVISVFRFGDICLILAMWMSHYLWHKNIKFVELNNLKIVEEHLLEHNWYAIFIALMIVLAAVVKSAQFPFSSWLPRAMEGPTTSSAIFYGSLSVHLGVFLLLRTFNYWESLLIIKILIICVGVSTCLIATSISKVQSSVKTQIAYSSIAQIGLIFIEIALGFHWLALFHFTTNATLRTYQLLVSPSVLSYLTHNMFYNFKPKANSINSSTIAKIKNSIYILSIKEWNLDFYLFHFLWSPFKWFGNKLNFLKHKVFLVLLLLLLTSGILFNYFEENIHFQIFDNLPYAFSFLGLILILKAFAERGDALWAWCFAIGGQLFIAISISLLNENFSYEPILIYLSGLLVAAVIGIICLLKIKSIDSNIKLNQYHGYIYEQPKIGFIFLIACLAFVGLPFTPTFIGIDLLFNNIHKHENVIIIFTALSFVFIEITILRIYARIFLGQYKKQNHAMAYRSS